MIGADLPTTVLAARRRWTGLTAPDDTDGRWAADFVTPLRRVAPVGLGLIGLHRWYGKELSGGAGVNLLHTTSDLRSTLPMRLTREPSWVDGRPAVVATYGERAPRPWRWVRDELRELDGDTLLGLTFTDRPGLRRVGLPFLLRRRG